MADIEFRVALVCDDVRREDNGKDIIIGVYSDTLVIPAFPATLQLTFWLQFYANEITENTSVNFRLIGDDDIKFAEMNGAMRTVRKGLGSIAVGPIPLALQVATKLTFQTKLPNEDWKTLREIDVLKGQITSVLPVRSGVPDVVAREKEAATG
jgi:hypothetical protein